MSQLTKKSLKLECSVSAAPMRKTTIQNDGKTKVSASAANMTCPTKFSTQKYDSTSERYFAEENTPYSSEDVSAKRQEAKQANENNEDVDGKGQESKYFDDWKDFNKQICGAVKSKADLIIAFTHYMLIKNGFRCLGIGDDKTYSAEDKGGIDLPVGWNHLPKYAIRYIYNRMLHLLISVHVEQRLLINLLNVCNSVVTNITLFPEITVRVIDREQIDALIPNPEQLAQALFSNLIETFIDTQIYQQPTTLSASFNQARASRKELEFKQSKAEDIYSIDEKIKNIEIHDIEMQSSQSDDEDARKRQLQHGTECLKNESG